MSADEYREIPVFSTGSGVSQSNSRHNIVGFVKIKKS